MVYAGKAILENLVEIQDYVGYYVNSWHRINKARSETDKQLDQEYMNVDSTFEIVYLDLKKRKEQSAVDAWELLNMFAFLNHRDIQQAMLQQAAVSPSAGRDNQQREQLKSQRCLGLRPSKKPLSEL